MEKKIVNLLMALAVKLQNNCDLYELEKHAALAKLHSQTIISTSFTPADLIAIIEFVDSLHAMLKSWMTLPKRPNVKVEPTASEEVRRCHELRKLTGDLRDTLFAFVNSIIPS